MALRGRAGEPDAGRGLLGVDVAFPVLHGPFGEDGTVQGMLETLGVAYVGSGVAASAVSLDKILFKELMSVVGVPQVDFVGLPAGLRAREGPPPVLAQSRASGCPYSSSPPTWAPRVGIVKVLRPRSAAAAVEQAFSHDERVIVEAAAPGREVECAVLGRLDGRATAARRDGAADALASPPGRSCSGGSGTTTRPSTRRGGCS